MLEEQLSAFFEAVKADAGLQEKLKGASDLDAALAIAQEAGFDVSKADWLKHQAKQTLELSDEELNRVTGGDSNGLEKNAKDKLVDMMNKIQEEGYGGGIGGFWQKGVK